MRLYYLTAQKWAKKIVEERRIKVSLLDDLNDPFELLPHVLPSAKHRIVVDILRQHLPRQPRLLPVRPGI
jgi:hypothetical protein